MKFDSLFIIWVAGLLNIALGVPRTHSTGNENGRGRGNIIRSPYRKEVHGERIDRNSTKQRREDCGGGYQCNNGDCIPSSFECDRYVDCEDHSDERHCGWFQCDDGTYIPTPWECDGVPDCKDDSDEKCGCEDGYKCDNGDCIESSFECDYFKDCDDSSDERHCEHLDWFPCNDGTYIPSPWKCDSVADCEDESDEGDECDPCSSTFRCNHLLQCPGGVDEEGCPTLSELFSLSTPGYPSTYEGNLNISWTFKAEEGKTLTFRCSDLKLESGRDWLLIGNGRIPDKGAPVKLTGSACSDFTSSGNSMWFRFTSDDTNGQQGFQGTVSVTGTQQNNTPEESSSMDYCGYNNYIVETRIIGGVNSNIEKWPWQVMLLRKTDSDYYPYYFKCGGTLISDRHVLTAAHCFDSGDRASDFQVALGRNHTSLSVNEGIRRNVAVLSVHEGFSEHSYEHDVAVLALDEPVTIPKTLEALENKFSTNRACVDDPGNHWNRNSDCFITGYGVTDEDTGENGEVLQEAEVIYMNHVDCEARSNFTDLGVLSPSVICGGAVNGSDSCKGDSGGPMVCRHEDLNYYVVGITSGGNGCGRPGWPGLYTSVADHYEWIMDNML